VVLASGKAACWGYNLLGQLGYGNTDNIGDNETPASVGTIALPGGQDVVAVSAATYATCALLHSGVVTCWGMGPELGLGGSSNIGDNETPASNPTNGGIVRLPGAQSVVAVAGGGVHTCALLADGKVSCWGAASGGVLGYGGAESIGDNETPANNPLNGGIVRLPGDEPAVAIAAGGSHNCAVLASGRVACWGYAAWGQLGYGNTNTIGDNEAPATAGAVVLPGGEGAVAITAGASHTCVILESGNVSCWGYNGEGELGIGTTDNVGDNETPGASDTVDLPGGKKAVAISAGPGHTCAILTDGTVSCWGYNPYGELGYGNTSTIGDDETPASAGTVALPGGKKAVAISAGYSYTCAVLSDGTVTCWGLNDFGQLGRDDSATIGDNETPAGAGAVALPGGGTAVSVTAGTGFACALLQDGMVSCWGDATHGYTGHGNTTTTGHDAVNTVASGGTVTIGGGTGTTARAVEAGERHVCAISSAGNPICWGYGAGGRLGYGNSNDIGDNETPAANPVNSGVVQLPQAAAAVEYRSLTPTRLLDTRADGATIDGLFQAGGKRSAGSTLTLQVRGRGGVAVDATSVTLTVAAVQPDGGGFVVAWPCDVSRPNASNVNYQPGGATANTVISKIAPDGTVCIYTSAAAHLIADVVGDTPPTSTLTTLVPARLVDTRPSGETVDDIAEKGGQITSGSPADIDIAGRGGVPTDATTVILNVSAVAPAGNGNVVVHPCVSPAPTASNINYTTGNTAANLVITKLDASGHACFNTSQNTHLIVDVVGYYIADQTPGRTWAQSFSPTRLVDTRAAGVTNDGRDQGTGQRAGGSTLTVQVTNRFPMNAAAVAVINVTAVAPTGNGFLTVYPCDQSLPNASSLNYKVGTTRAVQVLAKLSPQGTVCVYTSAAAHVIVDVAGASL
jgi:alpha-tubulin suppressor-like RCC1 family protein